MRSRIPTAGQDVLAAVRGCIDGDCDSPADARLGDERERRDDDCKEHRYHGRQDDANQVGRSDIQSFVYHCMPSPSPGPPRSFASSGGDGATIPQTIIIFAILFAGPAWPGRGGAVGRRGRSAAGDGPAESKLVRERVSGTPRQGRAVREGIDGDDGSGTAPSPAGAAVPWALDTGRALRGLAAVHRSGGTQSGRVRPFCRRRPTALTRTP